MVHREWKCKTPNCNDTLLTDKPLGTCPRCGAKDSYEEIKKQ